MLQRSLMFWYVDLLSLMIFCISQNDSSSYQEKNLQKILIQIIISSASIFACILTSSDPKLSRGLAFGLLHYLCAMDQSTDWSNLLPTNLQLNVESSSHDSF